MQTGSVLTAPMFGAEVGVVLEAQLARVSLSTLMTQGPLLFAPAVLPLVVEPAPPRVKLWMLLLASLELEKPTFSTDDIARLLGHTPQSVTKVCRQVFPRLPRQRRVVYYLEFRHVLKIIWHICRNGRGLPDRDKLYHQLLKSGKITASFPDDHIPVQIAIQHLEQQRKIQLSNSHQCL